MCSLVVGLLSAPARVVFLVLRDARGGGIGVYTTPSTNPEGVSFDSRGRQPTDTGQLSPSNPEGVTLGLSIWIDYRSVAAR